MGHNFSKTRSSQNQVLPRARKSFWFASTAFVPNVFLIALLPIQVLLISPGGVTPSWAGICSPSDFTGCGAPGGLGVPGRSGDGGVGNGQGGGSSHIDNNGVTQQDSGNWGADGAGGSGAQGDGGLPADGGGPGFITSADGTVTLTRVQT